MEFKVGSKVGKVRCDDSGKEVDLFNKDWEEKLKEECPYVVGECKESGLYGR